MIDQNEPENAIEPFLDIQLICQQAIDAIKADSDGATDPQGDELTITLPPKLSAAIRFEATMYGQTPQAVVLDALAESTRAFAESDFFGNVTPESLKADLLGADLALVS